MELSATIESILFYRNEPVSIDYLARVLGKKEAEVRASLETLRGQLAGRGVVLMQIGELFHLATHPEAGALIEKLTAEELSRDLGKAALETLSIVLYRGPVARSDIDYIRGVNSSFILRNLTVRGLVERTPHPTDARTFLYQPTFELLRMLGVSKREELPSFEETMAAFESHTPVSGEAKEEVPPIAFDEETTGGADSEDDAA